MPTASLYRSTGQSAGQMELPGHVFGLKPRAHHLWRSVTTHLANQRLGTVKTKRKGEVSGGGKKPFRQKGTGNARQGSIRAVQFVGGGIAHGPKPRDFSKELPRKMRRQALAESLSSKAQAGNVLVLENLSFEAPKTRSAVALLKELGVQGRTCLIVVETAEPPVAKSFRNLPGTTLLARRNVNPYEVLRHEVVVLTKESLDRISESASETAKPAREGKS